MPGRGILGAVVLVWLLIGVFAAWQLHYFENGPTNCVVNPKVVDCPKPQVPQPHENSLGL
jgi:hypothetical protein